MNSVMECKTCSRLSFAINPSQFFLTILVFFRLIISLSSPWRMSSLTVSFNPNSSFDVKV